MARKKTEVANTIASSNKKNAEEIRNWYNQNKRKFENYESAEQAIKKLRDISKNQNKSISTFNKENLRSYLQNIGNRI